MTRNSVRIFFEKKGRAIYISHLDLMRTMQRAIKRSGVPVWYSEGFNRRLYLNFPLALSVGVEGVHEPMDFYTITDITLEEVAERLNAQMPEGLRVVSAVTPVYDNKDLGFACYNITFGGDSEGLCGALDSYLTQSEIKVMKHSKRKGMVEVDIRPHIELVNRESCIGDMAVDVTLPAGYDLNLNSGVFIDSFIGYCTEKGINAELLCAKRTNILCKNREPFA